MYARDQEKLHLAHHGIKNQKWGIRRYQNEDGSLTAEGRKRYGTDSKREGTIMYSRTEETLKNPKGNRSVFEKQRNDFRDAMKEKVFKYDDRVINLLNSLTDASEQELTSEEIEYIEKYIDKVFG